MSAAADGRSISLRPLSSSTAKSVLTKVEHLGLAAPAVLVVDHQEGQMANLEDLIAQTRMQVGQDIITEVPAAPQQRIREIPLGLKMALGVPAETQKRIQEVPVVLEMVLAVPVDHLERIQEVPVGMEMVLEVPVEGQSQGP